MKEKRKIEQKELKSIQLSILDSVAFFCDKHGIKYYLFAGTLLGAIRHNGYIPWDDDIDICMRRKDYNRFIEEFNRDRVDEHRVVCIDNMSGYYLPFAKVINTKTTMKELTSYKKEIGVYIDVFPLDSVSADNDIIKSLNKKILPYRNILTLKSVVPDKSRIAWKNIVLVISKIVFMPLSAKYIINKINKLAQMYNGEQNCTNLAELMTFMYGMGDVWPEQDFESTVEVEFEGKNYKCPKGYNRVLTRMYGDYMKLPPIEKQISHHDFVAWWK